MYAMMLSLLPVLLREFRKAGEDEAEGVCSGRQQYLEQNLCPRGEENSEQMSR